MFSCEPASKKIWNKLSRKVRMIRSGGIHFIFREVTHFLINLLSLYFIFVDNFDHVFFHVFQKPYEIELIYCLFYFYLIKIPA